MDHTEIAGLIVDRAKCLEYWLANRTANSEGHLISLDDLNVLIESLPPHALVSDPTITKKSTDIARHRLMDQESFNLSFYSAGYLLKNTLDVEGICVAGGFLSNLLRTKECREESIGMFNKTMDIDVFFYRASKETAIHHIEDLVDRASDPSVFVIEGLCTVMFVGDSPDDQHPPIDFVLRRYETMASIAYGFDIPSPIFDGKTLWFSPQAAHMLVYSTIIVDPRLSSKTYASRLSKYADRAFALSFPAADPAIFDNLNSVWMFGSLRIKQRRRIRGAFVQGKLYPVEPEILYGYNIGSGNGDSPIRRLVKGSSLIFALEDLKDPTQAAVKNLEDEVIKEYLSDKDISFKAINAPDRFRTIYTHMTGVGFSPAEAHSFADSVVEKARSVKPNTIVRIRDIFAGQFDKLRKMADEYIDKIRRSGLWIENNPHSQFTGSKYPMIQEPKDWYEQYTRSSPVEPRYVDLDAVPEPEIDEDKAHLVFICKHATNDLAADKCPICDQVLHPPPIHLPQYLEL